jgi:hypothetical protein
MQQKVVIGSGLPGSMDIYMFPEKSSIVMLKMNDDIMINNNDVSFCSDDVLALD